MQKRFDCEVAVNKWSALSLIFVFVLPLFEDFVGKPEGEVATVDQRFVVLCPISDFVG